MKHSMAFTNLLMVLQCLLLLTIMQVSIAQNLPIDFIVAHNNARAQVGVGRVRWDYVLARYAQDYANSMVNSCNLVHSDGPYGENIAWGSGEFLTGTGAVDMWVSENQDYDYNSNTCAAGKVCGHYTQVVWRDSVRIGCARVTCNNNKGVFITCNYDPPGNYIGRWPYSISF